MKLLQSSAGNFLNMTPQEAKSFAEKLVKAADASLTLKPGGQAGFVQTIVIRDRISDSHSGVSFYGELDALRVGISPSWLDVHPSQETDLPSRVSLADDSIDRSQINMRLKTQ